MITLTAQADYGHHGQYVARIVGRDSKYTFDREFVGRKTGKRNETTEADIDEPGLYEICHVTRKGGKEQYYRFIVETPAGLAKLNAGGCNADGQDDKAAAMACAKRLEAGESFEEIVELVEFCEENPAESKYRLRSKTEAKRAVAAQTIDTATEQCWQILQSLPEKQARKVLTALKAKITLLNPKPVEPATEAAEVQS